MQELARVHTDIMDEADNCGTTNLFAAKPPPLPPALAARGVTPADWDRVVSDLVCFQSTEPFYGCPTARNYFFCCPGGPASRRITSAGGGSTARNPKRTSQTQKERV